MMRAASRSGEAAAKRTRLFHECGIDHAVL